MKDVEILVQRISATTHSVSVQPVISADGKLQSPLLVCFYEPKAPQCFHEELAEFTNLSCTHSTSGKFSSALEEDWLRRVFLKRVEPGSVVLIDKWTGWKKPMNIREVMDKDIDVRWIPEGATLYLQPLDVGYNRQYKEFLKILCHKIRRRHPDFIISKRKNLAALLSLIHRQFSAPRFADYIKHAWVQAGYVDERPPHYLTPPGFCLKGFPANSKCHCGEIYFVRCAYCAGFLCFKHYVIDRHDCEKKE
jgi:hypothetical protein